MSKWDIQGRIKCLNDRKYELESEIQRLEKIKGQIELEKERKIRQVSQTSVFFGVRREQAKFLISDIEGNAIKYALEKYADIYGVNNEEKIVTCISKVHYLLNQNCKKIDEMILNIQSEISFIKQQINYCEIKLRELEREDENARTIYSG